MIQLPKDAVPAGYRQISPFRTEQLFHSPSHNFTGTEQEFVAQGHAYKYRNASNFCCIGFS